MYAFKRVIVVSTLTLAAHSWSYPIYPFSEFLQRANTHRSVDIKSNIVLSKKTIVDRVSAEIPEKILPENKLAVIAAVDTTSLATTLASNSFDFSQNSNAVWVSGSPLNFYRKNRSSVMAGSGFGVDVYQSEKSNSYFQDEDIEALASHVEVSRRWVGLSLQNVLPSETWGAEKNDVAKKTGADRPASNVSRINVSEPSSIALMCSGTLGLILTRRLRNRSRKN